MSSGRSRLAARIGSTRPFQAMAVFERALQLEAAGRSVIHLEVGEPDFGTPAPVAEAAARYVAGGAVGYTPAQGLPALRRAISDAYAERLGAEVPPERIVVTTGASGALLLALAATMGPGDDLLLTDPGYPCNPNMALVCGARPRPVAVGPDTDYQFTAGLVAAHWGDATRGLLLATPSNPTGTVVPPAELQDIVEVVSEREGTCIVDEIYGELVYDRVPSTVLTGAGADDVFVVNSFSKTFGMTGWRLGWLVVPDWAEDAVRVLAGNLYISAPAPAQHAALAAFTPETWDIVEERRKEFAARRELLLDGLRGIGFDVPVLPAGAFYVYAGCERFGDSVSLSARLLEEAGVAVTPGGDFSLSAGDRHVRFAYTTSMANIAEALERMGRMLRA
jgi:aspartate/methionine/tyrosine aminotransferase